jgi:hypothetical protein
MSLRADAMRALELADDELLELGNRAKVGVGEQVDLHRFALGAADGREEVVASQGGIDLLAGDVEGVHAGRVEPQPHGEVAGAFDANALHALDDAQFGLDLAGEEVGQLREVHHVAGEGEVEGREGAVGPLDLDDGRLGLRREFAPHLVEAGADLGEAVVAVVVEAKADGDAKKEAVLVLSM